MRLLGPPTRYVALVLLLGACSENGSDGQIYSETHFLTQCESDNDCGSLSCICDVCTTPCDSNGSCAELNPNAVCAEIPEQAICSTGDPSGEVCLQLCSQDNECETGQVCRAGMCVEASDPTVADPDSDGDVADPPGDSTDDDAEETPDGTVDDSGDAELDDGNSDSLGLGPVLPSGWLCGQPMVVVEYPNTNCPACTDAIEVGAERTWLRRVGDVAGDEYDNGQVSVALYRAYESALGVVSPDEIASSYGEASADPPIRMALIGSEGDVLTAIHDREALPTELANLLGSLDAIREALPEQGEVDVGLPPLTPPVNLNSSCEDPFDIESPVLSIAGPDDFVFEPGAAGFADEDLPADLVITGAPTADGTLDNLVLTDGDEGVWTVSVSPLPASKAGINFLAGRTITVTARLSGSDGSYATSVSVRGERGLLFVMDSGGAGIAELDRSFVSLSNIGCGRRDACDEGSPSGVRFNVTSETYLTQTLAPGEWIDTQPNSGRGLRLLNTSPTSDACDPAEASFLGWGVIGSDQCGVRLRLNEVADAQVLDFRSAPDTDTWKFFCGEFGGGRPPGFGW